MYRVTTWEHGIAQFYDDFLTRDAADTYATALRREYRARKIVAFVRVTTVESPAWA